MSDGEGDLKDAVESAGESYKDPNDDDYVPDGEYAHHYCYVTLICLMLGRYKTRIYTLSTSTAPQRKTDRPTRHFTCLI